jgi:hypothetical protein
MRSVIDCFMHGLRAMTVLNIVLVLGVLYLAVVLMYIFPAYLYIAMPPMPPAPHVILSKITPLEWVGAICGLSVVIGIVSWKTST